MKKSEIIIFLICVVISFILGSCLGLLLSNQLPDDKSEEVEVIFYINMKERGLNVSTYEFEISIDDDIKYSRAYIISEQTGHNYDDTYSIKVSKGLHTITYREWNVNLRKDQDLWIQDTLYVFVNIDWAGAIVEDYSSTPFMFM